MGRPMLSSVVVVTFALLVLLLPASGSQASSLSALRGSAFVARGLRPSASTPLVRERHRCVHDLLQVSPTIVPTAQHRRQDAPHSWQPIVVAIDETVLTTAPVDVGYTCYATNDTFAGGTPCGTQDVVSESAVQFLSAVVLPTLRDIAQLLLAVDRPTADADYRVQLASTCNRIPVRDVTCTSQFVEPRIGHVAHTGNRCTMHARGGAAVSSHRGCDQFQSCCLARGASVR